MNETVKRLRECLSDFERVCEGARSLGPELVDELVGGPDSLWEEVMKFIDIQPHGLPLEERHDLARSLLQAAHSALAAHYRDVCK